MKSGFFRSPACNVASLVLALPFILSVVLVLVVVVSLKELLVFLLGPLFLLFILVLPFSLMGALLAVVSLFRREKRPLMAVLGLILNGGPLLLAVWVYYLMRDSFIIR